MAPNYTYTLYEIGTLFPILSFIIISINTIYNVSQIHLFSRVCIIDANGIRPVRLFVKLAKLWKEPE